MPTLIRILENNAEARRQMSLNPLGKTPYSCYGVSGSDILHTVFISHGGILAGALRSLSRRLSADVAYLEDCYIVIAPKDFDEDEMTYMIAHGVYWASARHRTLCRKLINENKDLLTDVPAGDEITIQAYLASARFNEQPALMKLCEDIYDSVVTGFEESFESSLLDR